MLCTIYCHQRTGKRPNKATGLAYTQVAIIGEPGDDEVGKNRLPDALILAPFGSPFGSP
jgi:hypothetical protein